MSKDIIKKTIDIPAELFDKVMQYSHNNRIYKFSPAVIKLIELALEKDRKPNVPAPPLVADLRDRD